MHSQYLQNYKVPAPVPDSYSNPSADTIFGSGSNSMSLPSSSCSGASSPRAGRSESIDGGLSTTTKRQRSRSSHVKQSKDDALAKAVKSNMIARVQMHLISEVNNRDVAKREKKLGQNEIAQLSQTDQKVSVLHNNFFKQNESDAQKKESPEAINTQKSYQGSLINLVNEKPQGEAHGAKTRANKIPSSHKLVFSNLSQQKESNTAASTPSSDMSVAAENQNVQSSKPSSFEMARNELDSRATQASSSSKHRRQNSLKGQASNDELKQSTAEKKLSLKINDTQEYKPLKQVSLTPNHCSSSAPLIPQPQDNTATQEQKSNELRSVQPALNPQERERQIKYLGLVIEKDEEQEIEEDDVDMFKKFKSLRAELRAFESGTMNTDEYPYIQRQYFPVRDRYIKIVKNCRRRSIESFEKRGGKDFRRTRHSLFSIAQEQREVYSQEMNVNCQNQNISRRHRALNTN